MQSSPFVTGRLVNWYRDILPGASQEIKNMVTEYQNETGICAVIFDRLTHPFQARIIFTDYCFAMW